MADGSVKSWERSWFRLRALSAAVLVVVSAIAVAGCLLTRGVVHDQQHKLLKQRTEEAGLYLSSALASVQTQLASLAAAAAAQPAVFANAARLLTTLPTGFKTIVLLETTGQPRVVVSAGTKLSGDLGGVRLAAISAAIAKQGLTGAYVATRVFTTADGTRHLGFAYASPILPRAAVYAESVIQPSLTSPTTSGRPFGELRAAVYSTASVRADQLIAATVPVKELPLRGATARVRTPVGAGPAWLLVAKARQSLVGSAATALPWAILGAGLLAALLATGIVETLARRREYALALVDVRTEELTRSLGDLASAHEQLVRQERLAAIGQLASTVGHELRNPLGVLSNSVYLLRGDLGPTPAEAAQRHLAAAEREISSATVIVSDLLEFARERDPALADVNVVDVVSETLSVLPPPTDIAVRRELPAQPVMVRADREMLRQVLLNLVGNAYQAMPGGGTVTVGVAIHDGVVQVRVHDTGVGMTEDVRSQLFEPFFTTKARGVGLGLAVTRRIVDAHGGDISVTSAPRRGSEFVVTLPSIASPREAHPAESPERVRR